MYKRQPLTRDQIFGILQLMLKDLSGRLADRHLSVELTDAAKAVSYTHLYHHGDTLCLSTQVGCKMGCKFCASTLDGCVRSLTPAEMLGQVVAANGYARAQSPDRRVHNIVLMGSGEPLDNYDNVIRFLHLVNAPEGLNIALRNISLSTCGLVPNIDVYKRQPGCNTPM